MTTDLPFELANPDYKAPTKKGGFRQSLRERFNSKVIDKGPDECWEWTASVNEQGYGIFRCCGQMMNAHRVAFAIYNGFFAEETRHTCDNPPCTNPRHLLDGSRSDNTMDSVIRKRHVQSRKTHCPHGHEYTPENTKIVPSTNGRLCVACARKRSRDFQRAKAKEARGG